MRVAGVDAARRGWVAVSLEASRPVVTVRAGPSLDTLLLRDLDRAGTVVVGIDMPLGLLETGWR